MYPYKVEVTKINIYDEDSVVVVLLINHEKKTYSLLNMTGKPFTPEYGKKLFNRIEELVEEKM